MLRKMIMMTVLMVSENSSGNFKIIDINARALPKKTPVSGDTGVLLKGFKVMLLFEQ